MKKVQLTSRKYDGSLRDRCEAYLYEETDEGWIVYTPPGIEAYDARHKTTAEISDGILGLYFKSKWYVVWHICEQNTNINQAYVHLSTPTRLTNEGLEWTDLDLDYRIHLDGRLERLDQDEYDENRILMGFSSEVQDRVEAASTEIEALYAAGAYPFDAQNQLELYDTIRASMHNEDPK